MTTFPKYYRSRPGCDLFCLVRTAEAKATIVMIPQPGRSKPLGYFDVTDKTPEDLNAICAGMLESSADKYEEYLIAFYDMTRPGAEKLHASRQERFKAGKLKL